MSLLEETYRRHPLDERRILDRVLSQIGTDPETELDLAIDPVTEITDQNHVGGAPFVVDLASAVGIGRGSRVVDLGCGLGGSCRLLAYLYGCSVLGIDLSEYRIAQARRLSDATGLTDHVSYVCGDLATFPAVKGTFDTLWSQNALLHLENPGQVLERWSAKLDERGSVGIEDVYLRRPPKGATESRSLLTLSEIWLTELSDLEAWKGCLSSAAIGTGQALDLTPEFIGYFGRRIEIAARPETPFTHRERIGFERAFELAKSGVVGYFRLTGVRE